VTHSIAIIGLLVACAAGEGRQAKDAPPPAPPQIFTVPVPAQAATAQLFVVLRDVSVPKNTPVRFRLYALVNGADSIALGSTAVPAISRQAEGAQTIPQLQVTVTDGLRAWLKTAPRSDSIRVSVRAFGDANREPAQWRVGSLAIVARR